MSSVKSRIKLSVVMMRKTIEDCSQKSFDSMLGSAEQCVGPRFMSHLTRRLPATINEPMMPIAAGCVSCPHNYKACSISSFIIGIDDNYW